MATRPFDGLAIVYTTVATAFTMFCLLWALCTVHKHPRLYSIVKFYLFAEHGLRMLLILMNFVWGALCILWYVDEVLTQINHIMGFIFITTTHAVYMAQMMFSLNRFFAIAFGGLHYEKLFTGKWKRQALSIAAFSLLLNTASTVAGSGVYYDLQMYTFTNRTDYLAHEVILILQTIIPLSVWASTLIMDVTMLILLHRQKQNFTWQTTAMNTEWKLALQMLVNHGTNILNVIDVFIIVSAELNQFSVFILTTVIMVVLPGFYGLNVVAFLSVRKTTRTQPTLPMTVFTTG